MGLSASGVLVEERARNLEVGSEREEVRVDDEVVEARREGGGALKGLEGREEVLREGSGERRRNGASERAEVVRWERVGDGRGEEGGPLLRKPVDRLGDVALESLDALRDGCAP